MVFKKQKKIASFERKCHTGKKKNEEFMALPKKASVTITLKKQK